MEQIKTAIEVITILAALWLASGCGVGAMSAKTSAVYEITSDGKKISYESSKEQQGLILDLQEENGKIKSVKIRVDKATTNDESVSAATLINLKLLEMVQGLLAEAKAAAIAGS